jgi:hypothetical protein
MGLITRSDPELRRIVQTGHEPTRRKVLGIRPNLCRRGANELTELRGCGDAPNPYPCEAASASPSAWRGSLQSCRSR